MTEARRPTSDGSGGADAAPRTSGAGHQVSDFGPRTPDLGYRTSDAALLRVEHLTTVFDAGGGALAAVADVSFHVDAGETLCLVGESGCGKSVTALSILRLVQPPGRIAGGRVFFDGRDLLTLDEREMRRVRGGGIGLVFQEPMTALNPVFTIGDQIEETLAAHGIARGRAAKERAIALLDAVSIPDAARRVRDYPHQLSGGLRQRALIALALAGEPALLVADEPTTALDVTVQAQILDLLRSLQQRFGLGLLLITHDLGVVAEMADRVAVMYAGRIVEHGPSRELFHDPRHPYTKGLLASTVRGTPGERLPAIAGTVPSIGHTPPGCAFHPRCPARFDPCDKAVPGVTTIVDVRRPTSDVRSPEGSTHLQTDLGPRTSDLDAAAAHETRCYLYSPAIDPARMPEERA
jgi:oligopeptide/dipeptide ABC transporter ATP-binding protein